MEAPTKRRGPNNAPSGTPETTKDQTKTKKNLVCPGQELSAAFVIFRIIIKIKIKTTGQRIMGHLASDRNTYTLRSVTVWKLSEENCHALWMSNSTAVLSRQQRRRWKVFQSNLLALEHTVYSQYYRDILQTVTHYTLWSLIWTCVLIFRFFCPCKLITMTQVGLSRW